MRYAFIADIHANYDALLAVLAQIDAADVQATYCLGDLVGYGAEPSQCVRAVRERQILTVAGNHDFAVVGKLGTDYFNPDAQDSVHWTRSALTPEDCAYLGGLPLAHQEDSFAFTHGTFLDPAAFEYILTARDAELCFAAMPKPYAFVAHSHVPMTFFRNHESIGVTADPVFAASAGYRAIFNVGSVGQPRDANPSAAFVVFDSDARAIEVRRVAYDIDAAARKIFMAGLPPSNAYRLYLGR